MVELSRNHVKFRPLSAIKNLVVRPGMAPRTIMAGLYKGIILNLNLRDASQFYLGLYERETFSSILQSSKRARWMIDVGAGCGDMAIYFLRCKNIIAVHAFEPQSSERHQIEINIGLNGLFEDPRLFVESKYVGTTQSNNYVRLDDIPVDRALPGFIKIDVDGFEVDVIKSGLTLLSSSNVDVLIEVHSEELEEECKTFLSEIGYHVKVIDNAWWRVVIPERRPIPHNRWIRASRGST